MKSAMATTSTSIILKSALNLMASAKSKTSAVVRALFIFIGVGTTSVAVSQSLPAEPAYLSQLRKEAAAVYVFDQGSGRHISQLSIWSATAASFSTLTNAPELESLEFVGTDMQIPAFNLISNLTNLKSLTFFNCKIIPAQLAAIQNLTNLEKIKIDFTSVLFNGPETDRAKLLGKLSPAETQTAAMLKQQEVYDNVIEATLLTDRAMPYLSKLVKLKTLNLNRSYISPGGLKQLVTLTNLEEVDFSPMGLDRQTALPFQSMTKLRSLEYFNVDDGLVGTLSKITTLEHLNLWSGDVTDASTNYFASLTNLNHLEIRGNKMTDAGLLQLAKLAKLKYLDIEYATRITPNGIARFQQHRPDIEIKH